MNATTTPRPNDEPVAADPVAIASVERQLLAAHAASVVSSIAGGVAHHFNNLLGGMLGLVTLAPNLDREALTSLSERLRDKIEHASRLTQVLLGLTRRAHEEEANATCELTSRTREVCVLAATAGGPGVVIDTRLPDCELWAVISPVTFSRALLNLLVSPMDTADRTDGLGLQVTLSREAGMVALAVRSLGYFAKMALACCKFSALNAKAS